MPAMGKLQRVAKVQTLMVEPPLVNMASKLTGNPVREGTTVTDNTDDRPEDTTLTGGVVVGAVEET